MSFFKPRARLLLQLGDQLIRNENIAIIELVKNAYDADSSKCTVVLSKIDSKVDGEIKILDDGIGMTPEIIKNIWLEPGADIKAKILDGEIIDGYKTKRAPIGEKGIGRFGVHKLGDYIEMVTKSAKSKSEVVVKIDWDKFKEVKYLDEASFSVKKRVPQTFKNGNTGTSILIKKIKSPWSKDLYKDLHRSLLSLTSPFDTTSGFKPSLVLNLLNKSEQDDWKKDLPKVEELKDKALWEMNCTINGEEITDFVYKFSPWAAMDKLSQKVIDTSSDEYKKVIRRLNTKEKQLNLDIYKIGEIKIEAYLFDLSPKILSIGIVDKKALAGFLSRNGGVRVYRDNLRIYNYGEPGDDWLELDKSRINQPSQTIGNKNIIAAVQLSRAESRELREKTNREGFVEDQAYLLFKDAVQRAIEVFGQLRNIDKKKVRELYEGSSNNEPVIYDIDVLKETVQDKLMSLEAGDGEDQEFVKSKEVIKNEILNGLDRIKRQYSRTNSILLKSAGAGLSLGVVVHEIDKRIKELTSILDPSITSFEVERVRSLVRSISKLVENYSVLLSTEKKTKIDLKTVIQDSIFNTEFRFKAHDVDLIKMFKNHRSATVQCSLNTIVGVLLNIFDNSIFWLNYYEIKNKKIYIDIKEYGAEEISIIIADNGKGFALPLEDAIQPFVSMKPGGMGLGLHIASEMLKVHNGRLLMRDYKETSGIPEEFKKGAILELVFKRKSKHEIK